MNTKTTAILLIVFALAIGALVVLRGPADTPAESDDKPDQGETGEALLDPERLGQSLERITFDSGELGTLLELERADGRWHITQPYRFPAKTRAVDELLAKLAALRGSPTEEAGGLVPDANGLILGYASGETSLWFSARRGAGRAIVTLIDDDGSQNYNAPDTLHDYFDAFDPAAFYADRIATPLMPELSRIEITMPEGTSVLTQRDGGWRIGEGENAERALAQPIEGQAGLSDYFKLLSRIELGEMQPYAGEDALAQFGLSDPLIRIRFLPFDEAQASVTESLEVRVGVPADPQDKTRYLSVGPADAATPAVFTAPTPDALRLGQPATTFRDPRVIAMQASLIESVLFYPSGQILPTLRIEFDTNGSVAYTKLRQDDLKGAVSAAKTGTLLRALTSATASGYVRQDLDEIDRLMRIRIEPRLSGSEESIAIFADPESQPDRPTVLISRGAEPVLLRVEREAVQLLLEPALFTAEQ